MFEKMAKIAVNYSLGVKKGNRVLIRGPDLAKELILALYAEVLKVGAHPFIRIELEGEEEIFYELASDDQLTYTDELLIHMIKEFDSLIAIRADFNTRYLADVDSEKIKKKLGSEGLKRYRKIMEERVKKGELNWVLIPFPCQAYAQDADMGLHSYTKFIEKSIFLDKDDPIKEWKKIRERQEKLVKELEKFEKIEIIGKDTNLTMSVKGRKWINCCGDKNLPDGEIFTGPVEDSVNGKIRFTYPAIRYGQEVQNIFLEFKDGKVINSSAAKGEAFLKDYLTIENADRIGEFAIATNYGIQRFTKNILFDEKIGGTLHCALGFGFKETGSKNEAAVHWDFIKDMKVEGSKVLGDGKIIYEEGKWKL
ncbi:MAG: aminopeptidase [Candidatus Lokiarchaeota archaeon]|nr:aminopeptidase [Candidatus Lokiarchaeota archaeon]MBD3198855.1 aminopeptidase [Candidatus Lokiarchaeota archaeon]